jgi:hypothetical protein
VIEQIQAKAKKTQVTSVGAMDDLDPAIPFGNHTQIHDPDIGQAGCDHQTRQSRRIRDVTLVQVESPAFLIGEEGF